MLNKKRAKIVLDLAEFGCSSKRILGVQWDYEDDKFQFNISMKDKPFTMRGILYVGSSLFDPLIFVASVVRKAKYILQSSCKEGLGWDKEIRCEQAQLWKRWMLELPQLRDLRVERCFKALSSKSPEQVQIHFFSDSS